MIFVQEAIYQDQIFGKWVSRFVVSDVYSDMFKTDAQITADLGLSTEEFRTNIFQLGKVKESMKKEEGSFAMSELGFKVSTSAVQTVTDKRAFFFCLHASNFKKHRYCATFLYPFGSVFDDTDRIFTGKITTSISGDEIDWIGASPWDSEIYPEVEIDFKALQFDLSVLKELKLDKKIKIPDGTEVDSIYDRFTEFDGGNGDIESNFKFKPLYMYTYQTTTTPAFIEYTSPLGTLYNAIKLILDKSVDILFDMLGVNFEFNLLETDLQISTNPTSYTLRDILDNPGVSTQTIVENSYHQLYMAPEGSPNYEKNIWIQLNLLKPHFGSPVGIHSTSIPVEFTGQMSHSFVVQDNVTTLLGEIARALGCVVITRFTSATQIDVEFISNNKTGQSTDVYIYGVNSSNFDSASIAKEKSITYYGEANRVLLDGGPDQEVSGDGKNTYQFQKFDPIMGHYYTTFEPTEALSEFKQKIKADSLKEYKRLILTTSWPIVQFIYPGGLIQSNPIAVGDLFSTPYRIVANSEYYNPSEFNSNMQLLNTGIYIKLDSAPEAGQRVLLGENTPVWRYATNISRNIDGKNKKYSTLSEYVNDVNGEEKLYYENTRKVTIPSWNGFDSDANGTSPTWKKLKIGHKITLKVKTLEYDEVLGQWIENWSPVQKWIILSIERSLEKPETTIELIDESVSSLYGNYQSGKPTGTVQGGVTANEFSSTPPTDISNIGFFECNETILTDYAVALRDDGKIEKFEPLKSKHYNKFIGIAKQDGVATEFISVQVAGVVVLENVMLDVNKSLFVRKSAISSPNLEQTILTSKTVDEDMIFRLCRKPLSDRSFRLEPEYMIYE